MVTLVAWHDRVRQFSAVPPCACWSSWARSVCRQLLLVAEADIKAQAPETVPGKMEQLMVGYAMVDALPGGQRLLPAA